MEQFVISVAAPKGGVGKTTTAINLSAGLALKEKKTLLVDVDPSGNCSSALGYNEGNIFGKLIDIYTKSKNVNEVIHKTELEYLDIIPFEKIDYKQEVTFNSLTKEKLILREAINSVKHQYDYVILDCPPYLYGSSLNSLLASDFLIIPTKSSKFSLDSVDKIKQFIEVLNVEEGTNITLDGILLTMHEKNTKASFHAKTLLYGKYPNSIFRTTIPKNITIAESTFYNKPCVLYDSEASASKAYIRFVDELIERHETHALMKLSGFENNLFGAQG